MSSTCRVAPFGNPRIKSYVLIPVAYRSLSRPSSPLRAKASTVCPYLLSSPHTLLLVYADAFISVESLSLPSLRRTAQEKQRLYCCLLFNFFLPICQRTFRLLILRQTCGLGSLPGSVTLGGEYRSRTDDLLRARQALYPAELIPLS